MDIWTRDGIGIRNGDRDRKEVGYRWKISEEMEIELDGGEGTGMGLWTE